MHLGCKRIQLDVAAHHVLRCNTFSQEVPNRAKELPAVPMTKQMAKQIKLACVVDNGAAELKRQQPNWSAAHDVESPSMSPCISRD
jgi:hypothetical protein